MKAFNLKCEGLTIWDKEAQKRAEKCLKFIGGIAGRNVLDIGGANGFGNYLADKRLLEYYATDFDLNYYIPAGRKFDNVFCFEVLEHLFNPLLCLDYIRDSLKPGGKLYVSVPKTKPRIFWGNTHWHEFDKHRFELLLHTAGFKIVKQGIIRNYHNWKFMFTGIRPFLRFFIFKPYSRIYICEINLQKGKSK